MALTDCPMCNTPIPAETQSLSSCGSCGADLSRWKPAVRQAPPILTVEEPPQKSGEFILSRGIIGALLGASIGVALMYGFYLLMDFRFPLLGVGIGYLTGFGARKMFKGTDNTLGMISGGIALVAVVATLYLMYGEFPLLSIISVVVSVSVAYRTSAHS